jgi:hypothetical protein
MEDWHCVERKDGRDLKIMVTNQVKGMLRLGKGTKQSLRCGNKQMSFNVWHRSCFCLAAQTMQVIVPRNAELKEILQIWQPKVVLNRFQVTTE